MALTSASGGEAPPASLPAPPAADAALFAAGRARRRRIASGATLGSGASGRVRAAVCLDNRREVAVKSVWCPADAAERRAARHRFGALSSLNHPNVCRVFEMFETRSKVYTVMELCAMDLRTYLTLHGPLPEHLIRPVLRSILSGLAYLHSRGIAHRDLKPSNILLRRPEADPSDLALADFDNAGICGDFGTDAQGQFSQLAGTPFYLAPEIVRCLPYGRGVDVWAAGCIAVELATGRTPFAQAEDFHGLFAAICECRWAGLPAGFSHGFGDLVTRMLCPDQGRRATAAEALAHPWFWEMERIGDWGRYGGAEGQGAWLAVDAGPRAVDCIAV
ncbi:kinase-like domain-containing protein [Hyaloraphidium curvatum]|nr:kinase-like domain-containing protein [Hyaloraphidium curvatum]KAI9021360.1 kinase-like domain-containing protein [Hyaloraphidium curvatum]